MNSNPKLTDDQLNPADFDQSIPEISPPLPETAENNEKLRQMDALVASYIAECNAEVEKNAKNAEKKEENWQEKDTFGNNCQNMENIGNNRTNKDKIAESLGKKGQKRNWYFSGEQIRIILRNSTIKQAEVFNHFNISKGTFTGYLRRETFPPAITKYIAHKLELNTAEELQEYYDMTPKEVRESVQLDGRIYRPLKPGIYIPPDVYWSAREMGKLGDVLAAARARAGR